MLLPHSPPTPPYPLPRCTSLFGMAQHVSFAALLAACVAQHVSLLTRLTSPPSPFFAVAVVCPDVTACPTSGSHAGSSTQAATKTSVSGSEGIYGPWLRVYVAQTDKVVVAITLYARPQTIPVSIVAQHLKSITKLLPPPATHTFPRFAFSSFLLTSPPPVDPPPSALQGLKLSRSG